MTEHAHTHTYSAYEANVVEHFASSVLFMGQQINLCFLGKGTKNEAK